LPKFCTEVSTQSNSRLLQRTVVAGDCMNGNVGCVSARVNGK